MTSPGRTDLLSTLDPLGFRAGRIDLPHLWPAIKSWLLLPGDAYREFYLSRAPGDGTPSFAGEPPAPIAGQDLVCIELSRDDEAGIVFWYADGPAWEPLAREHGWIDVGPMTPHIDTYARGEHTAHFPASLEATLAFQIACDQHPLAAEITSRLDENLLVLAAG